MPWTPPPGGVDAEQRWTPGSGVAYGTRRATGRVNNWRTSCAPPLTSPPTKFGLRRSTSAQSIADRAATHSMTVSVEVLRDEMNGSLYSDLARTFELIDDVGADNVGVLFDIWHMWDAPDVLMELETVAHRIFAVQLADWRDPTRWNGDRVLPGDGIADIPALLGALERNGFTGVYDVEVFSDASRPGSIWEGATAAGVLDASWSAFDRLWSHAGL